MSDAAIFEGVTEFESGQFPSLHQRKEGNCCVIKKKPRFKSVDISQTARYQTLLGQPPRRGWDLPRFQFTHTFDDRAWSCVILSFRSQLNEIDSHCVSDQFRGGLQAKIPHNFIFMRFDRPRRYIQKLSDFLHRPALRQEP